MHHLNCYDYTKHWWWTNISWQQTVSFTRFSPDNSISQIPTCQVFQTSDHPVCDVITHCYELLALLSTSKLSVSLCVWLNGCQLSMYVLLTATNKRPTCYNITTSLQVLRTASTFWVCLAHVNTGPATMTISISTGRLTQTHRHTAKPTYRQTDTTGFRKTRGFKKTQPSGFLGFYCFFLDFLV